MPPGPSEPASMPIIRNSIRAGIPNLKDVLLAMMLTNNNRDPISNIFSVDTLTLEIEMLR